MTFHYTPNDLKRALATLPLERGDTLFIHSNLGFFGRAQGSLSGNELCQMFFDALMEHLGGNGTLVVPTFTYSFARQQTFDPDNTASEMGLFSEWLRCHPGARRSLDPCYSVAAIGAQADKLTRNTPENSFAPSGFFGRLLAANGRILNLNLNAGSTFIHYVERELQVPYRFDKTFEGWIRQAGKPRKASNTIWVRYLSSNLTQPAFESFDRLAQEKGYLATTRLGRGQICTISAADTFRAIADTLPTRPWLLTLAEKQGQTPELLPEITLKTIDYKPDH